MLATRAATGGHEALRGTRRLLLALGLLLVATWAHAASLQVAPTRVTIQHDRGADGLMLSNSGADPVHAQVRVFRWWQQDGRDMLEPTDDLVISPPMLQIPAGGEQLVRIVHTGSPPPPGGERTYRVVVDELPIERTAPQGPGLRFALRYSIPVFVVAAADAPPAASLVARLVGNAPDAAIEITNTGAGSAQLADLVLIGADGTRRVVAPGLAGYVMPGQSRQWPMPSGASPQDRIEAKLNGEPQARALVPDR